MNIHCQHIQDKFYRVSQKPFSAITLGYIGRYFIGHFITHENKVTCSLLKIYLGR